MSHLSIDSMRKIWVGRVVEYKGERYHVVDVSGRNKLIIDRPNEPDPTTTVFVSEVTVL